MGLRYLTRSIRRDGGAIRLAYTLISLDRPRACVTRLIRTCEILRSKEVRGGDDCSGDEERLTRMDSILSRDSPNLATAASKLSTLSAISSRKRDRVSMSCCVVCARVRIGAEVCSDKESSAT